MNPAQADGSCTLALGRAHPGMVLAEDLPDRHGGTLLAAGTLLSGSILAALAKHGVGRMEVRTSGNIPLVVSALDMEPARRRVAHLFRHSADDAITKALLETVLDFRTGRGEWNP